MLRLYRKEEGFTLIELLIVVAIIGILAGIAVPRVTGNLKTAKENACKANISAIESVVQLYSYEEGNLTAGDLKNDESNKSPLVSKGYLKEIPTCPLGGTYSVDTNGIVTCSHS